MKRARVFRAAKKGGEPGLNKFVPIISLAKGINTYDDRLTNRPVAEALGLKDESYI